MSWMRQAGFVAAVWSAAMLCGVAAAQGVAPAAGVKTPQYDVVTIKPNTSGSGSVRISTRDATFMAINVPLKNLIANAFDVRFELISGLPAWAENARYDVQAKVVDAADAKEVDSKQRRAMLRRVLEERFGLKAHVEEKTLPVYELVLDKGGPKFKEASADAKFKGVGMGGTSVNNRNLVAHGVPMTSLAGNLEGEVRRTVIDATGLTGKYDVELVWSGDDMGERPDPNNTAPGIFTAVEEQLGLKLKPAKGPVPTLVVDAVQEPTEN